MVTKTISIMEDAYMLLLNRKMSGESFSDVIRRNFNKKRNIMEFAGAWKDLVSEEEAEEMKRSIREFRAGYTKGVLKKIDTK